MSEKASFAAAASQLWNQNKEVIGNKNFNINLKVENSSDEKNTSSKDIPKTGYVFGSNLAARVAQQVEKKDDGPKSASEILQRFSKTSNSTGFAGFTSSASTSKDWLKSVSDDQPKVEDEPVEKPITGEEDETNIFQAPCKIFQYDTEAKAWKERGLGTIRLNENNDFDYNNPARSRLVARSAGSQKVLINSPLFYEMVFEAVSEKRLKISATAPDSNIPQLFLIQSTPSLIGQLKALLRTRLKKSEINTLEESLQRKRKATEADGGTESKKTQNGGKAEKDGTEASGEDSTNESEDYDSSANDS